MFVTNAARKVKEMARNDWIGEKLFAKSARAQMAREEALTTASTTNANTEKDVMKRTTRPDKAKQITSMGIMTRMRFET